MTFEEEIGEGVQELLAELGFAVVVSRAGEAMLNTQTMEVTSVPTEYLGRAIFTKLRGGGDENNLQNEFIDKHKYFIVQMDEGAEVQPGDTLTAQGVDYTVDGVSPIGPRLPSIIFRVMGTA